MMTVGRGERKHTPIPQVVLLVLNFVLLLLNFAHSLPVCLYLVHVLLLAVPDTSIVRKLSTGAYQVCQISDIKGRYSRY